jgi:ribonucleoside-diphosphate reductase subunit M2
MNVISMDGKTNFFERRVSEYAKAGVGVSRADQVFKLDAEF